MAWSLRLTRPKLAWAKGATTSVRERDSLAIDVRLKVI